MIGIAGPNRNGGSGAVISMPDEAAIKFCITDAIRRACLQALGSEIQAVVLTGSMARNEASWRSNSDGVEFLSDAEFMVFVREKPDASSKARASLICDRAEQELRQQGIICRLSCGIAAEEYLSGVAEMIFGHELLTCGEVLYGDPSILARQAATANKISREDAWQLLANRLLELLEIVPEIAEGGSALSEAAQYRLAKLYCDMATSLLVFQQEYVAGYEARLEALQELQRRNVLPSLPLDMSEFVETVSRCTRYKTGHEWDGVPPFANSDAVQKTVAIARALWAWELAQMDGAANGEPDALLRRHMQRQKIRQRLRGWIFVVRCRGLGSSVPLCWRWLRLSRVASPRYCVYAAALEFWADFYSESSLELSSSAASTRRLEIQDAELAAVRNWLPIENPYERAKRGAAEAAEAIFWNYTEFLIETRS